MYFEDAGNMTKKTILFYMLTMGQMLSWTGCSPGKSVKSESNSNSTDNISNQKGVNEKTGYPFFQNYYEVVSKESMGSVEAYMGGKDLSMARPATSLHNTDSCDPLVKEKTSLGDRISYQIYNHASRSMVPGTPSVGKHYGWAGKPMLPNSLMSHDMCEVTAKSLELTLGDIKKVPDAKTIDQMNRYTLTMNNDRKSAQSGNPVSRKRYLRNWNSMMMCLAYMESLPTADTNDSFQTAKKYAPDFKKPGGVEFYEDDLQPETSSLNIGLYQFTPRAAGNVYPCLLSWNQIFKGKCEINPSSNEQQMIRVLGSGYQTFNAFCGVNKIVQVFSIQVNTEKSTNTHPSNLLSTGQLKSSPDRCVSPFFSSKLSYNHFGPLQNSYGNRLEDLMNCIDASLDVP
jgi:hypothetical protein